MINEGLFFVGFALLVFIFLVKVFNIMSVGQLYDNRIVFLGFVVFLLAYFLVYVVHLSDFTEIVYSTLYRLSSALLVFVGIATAIELFINLGTFSTGYVKSNMPNKR